MNGYALIRTKKERLMILKNNKLFFGALFLCLPSMISANITTLQSWDPFPIFNAANLNIPPDTPFCNNIKRRISDDSFDKNRHWGLNISPFVQKAVRAQKYDNIYYGDTPINGVSTKGLPSTQMSDYQGTPYLMGLFLGQDVDGNSIWGGPTDVDTGVVTDITADTVADLSYLGSNLQYAINQLNNNPDPVTTTPPDYNNALLYNTGTNPLATDPTYTAPSILSQNVLEDDKIYFGAFSSPLTYQKAGFRWEVNIDFSDSVGFIVRGGFCQILQRTTSPFALSSSSDIYSQLNTVYNASSTDPGSLPYSFALNTFDEWVTNNVDSLLDATNGADYDIGTFSQTGIEDMQVLAFARHPFPLHPVDTDKYSSVMLTPYVMLGGTIPIAPVKDYSKLYALPFGNNSHPSFGGVMGVTVDFMQSIEFGFEFGATAFLPKNIDSLPVPNHELQRVLYPYRENVKYSPGFNGQFSGIFNAYKFTRNVSFSLRYNYVQHNKDTITLITPSPYFLPEKLEELSIWNSQMFTGALIFELQPSVYLSIAWQGALSQKNAYCSNTILTSLNFLF